MGYTHYWSFNKTSKVNAGTVERRYQLAIRRINQVAKFYQSCQPKGSDTRLSGYTAFTPKYGGVHINGSRGNDHEDFTLREHYNENNWGSCKTARKPYDVVVVASLILLKHYLKQDFQVDSDGDRQDWLEGLYLVREAAGLKSLQLPKNIESGLGGVS